jgi:chitinase
MGSGMPENGGTGSDPMGSDPTGSDRSGEDATRRARQAEPASAPPRRHRLLPFVLLVAIVAAVLVHHGNADGGAGAPAPFYAPYVDVTLPPSYPFQQSSADPSHDVVLGFVVAASPSSCTPSWGGSYSLTGAASSLHLEARVAKLRAEGGEALVSFGGASGSELALACSSATSLKRSYGQVIERYHLKTIDLDIEGSALGDGAATQRRAEAVASLQREKRRAGEKLGVWLTLPVTPNGLPPAALAVVREMLSWHVQLAGVNAMTMDYGAPGDPARDVLSDAERSLVALNHQLQAAYRAESMKLSAAAAWRLIGATPMIGVSDVAGEAFTLADARKLTAFAKRFHMARLSMWSLNRDVECPEGADTASASNRCSGVSQRPRQFSSSFAAFAGG